MRITTDTLTSWPESVLNSIGFSGPDATDIADTLVDANRRGADSHGVMRLPIYERRIAAGLVDPSAHPIDQRSGSTVRSTRTVQRVNSLPGGPRNS